MKKKDPPPSLRSASKAWFLGPKAENEDLFEHLLLDAFRDYCYWRRNFHPEDEPAIKAADRLDHGFQEYRELLRDRLFEMVSQLKRSSPLFSPRYLGHMASDLLIPGVLGYAAAMLYNQNNIYQEASTITLQLETQALKLIAAMLHYDPEASAWGHLCSGGTAANLESLWLARTVRLFPYQSAAALDHAATTNREVFRALSELPVSGSRSFGDVLDADRLHRMNLGEIVGLRRSLSATAATRYDVAEFVKPFLGYGLFELSRHFSNRSGVTFPAGFKVYCSTNAHYSMLKALGVIGLGESNLVRVPLDSSMRLDASALEAALVSAFRNDETVLAVVGVYGSTEEGAIDDFEALADMRGMFRKEADRDYWLHGDACYGGYALAMSHPLRDEKSLAHENLATFMRDLAGERGSALRATTWTEAESREWLRKSLALSRCDSISIDPHKLGYIPYPAGAVLFRDYAVREFVRYDAPYLNIARDEPGSDRSATVTVGEQWNIGDLGKYTLEGSRPGAAGAAVWLTHKTIPLNRDGHGRVVAQTVLGTRHLRYVLESSLNQVDSEGVGCCFLCPKPDLNILCYTFPSILPAGEAAGEPMPVSLAVLNRSIVRLFSECLPTEDRPTLTRDFVVSMTSLSAHEYGDTLLEFLNRLERLGLTGTLADRGSDGRLKGNPWLDDDRISVFRTVVMSPFFLDAQTRPRLKSSRRPLVEEYADFLQSRLTDIFLDELNQPLRKSERPTLKGNVLVVEETEETLVALCSELRRGGFRADHHQVVGVKTLDLAWNLVNSSDVVLIDAERVSGGDGGFRFFEALRDNPRVKGAVFLAGDPKLRRLLNEGAERRSDWKVTIRAKPDPFGGRFQTAANQVMSDVWAILNRD